MNPRLILDFILAIWNKNDCSPLPPELLNSQLSPGPMGTWVRSIWQTCLTAWLEVLSIAALILNVMGIKLNGFGPSVGQTNQSSWRGSRLMRKCEFGQGSVRPCGGFLWQAICHGLWLSLHALAGDDKNARSWLFLAWDISLGCVCNRQPWQSNILPQTKRQACSSLTVKLYVPKLSVP